MANRVSGGVFSNETLTGNLDFFTLTTVVEVAEGNWGDTESATRNLITLINAISLRAQPIMVSVSVDEDASVTGLGFGTGITGTADVATIKFAIEHTTAADEIAAELDGVALPFGSIEAIDTQDAATKNTVVVKSEIL